VNAAPPSKEKGMGALVEFQTGRWFGDAFRANQKATIDRLVKVFLDNNVDCYVKTCEMLGDGDLRAGLATNQGADCGCCRRRRLRDAGGDGRSAAQGHRRLNADRAARRPPHHADRKTAGHRRAASAKSLQKRNKP